MARFVATTTRGTEEVLASELKSFGIKLSKVDPGAVRFQGPLLNGYKACLWSRIASRVLLIVDRFPIRDAETMYDGVRKTNWAEHIPEGATMAVTFVGTTRAIRNTQFGALKVKDAIVDQLRELRGDRPNIDPVEPDVRIHVHLRRAMCQVAIDLSGVPLHERAAERRGGPASMKENLAAAILHLADWPKLAAQGVPFMDPMCGAGTLALEAAGIALGRAPGLDRAVWGFTGWGEHDKELWKKLQDEAREREDNPCPPIFACDIADAALRTAEANAIRAGLSHVIEFRQAAVEDLVAPLESDTEPAGLMITNPPYGVRIGGGAGYESLYRTLGDVSRRELLGWSVYIFTGSPELAKSVGLRPRRRIPLHNGPIECRLLWFPIRAQKVTGHGPGWRKGPAADN